MVTEAEINEAWKFLRLNNSSIPSETLDFIKLSAMRELRRRNITYVEKLSHFLAENVNVEIAGKRVWLCPFNIKELITEFNDMEMI